MPNSCRADPSSAFYLKLDQVKTPAGWQPVVGTIRVQVDEPVPNIEIGNYIQAYCWLHRFEEPTNPGQFNFARVSEAAKRLCGGIGARARGD